MNRINGKGGLPSLLLLGFLLCAVSPSLALGGNGASELAWGAMGVGLFGGLALFLYGMEKMTASLKAAAGEKMKGILERLTTNRFTGAFTGAMVTAVIQSSSVTTVLVVGFVSAGLMSLGQSIGVIMGANIGTTLTAQILAFEVDRLALVFIAVGFAMLFFARREGWRHWGGILMGLGLVFYGMNVMSEAMAPLRGYPPFLDMMVRMENPALGIVAGCVFTALVQSSSATTGFVVVMASQGFITLPAGIALALGANVGTCITAVLAAAGKPRTALRTASVHVVFNVLGVALWLPFIDRLAEFSVLLSPLHPELFGLERLAAETPRQIANANTLFNVANTLLFIGFTTPLAHLVTRIFPEKAPRRELIRPRYLDEELIGTPALALNVARLEIGHIGEHIGAMLERAHNALATRHRGSLADVERMDDAADILHGAVIRYLSRIGKQSLTEAETAEYFRLTQIAGYLEIIGDIIETDMVALGRQMLLDDLHPSPIMWQLLDGLNEDVGIALERTVTAVAEGDPSAAQEVVAMKLGVEAKIDAAFKRQTESLAGSAETRVGTLMLEFEMIDKLKRIYSNCKRIARILLPREET